LLDGQAASSNLKQQEIKQDFEKAEQTFDEILQAIADELDKLPPEDPIAALLRDPTLDEILAQLEREQDLLERESKKRKLAKDNLRWNLLVSKLRDDMLQGDNKIPPERYRSAIEQYTDQISKLKNGQEENE